MSPTHPDVRCYVQMRGNASLACDCNMKRTLNGSQPETLRTDKEKHLSSCSVARQPEGTASIVSWNPKRVRGSAGPQSRGALSGARRTGTTR